MEKGKLTVLKTEDVISKKEQPRKTFDQYELKILSENIKEKGLLQPLTVRRGERGKYILIAGERRLRAARLAGIKKIPCIVREADDLTADTYTIIENFYRRDLNPFEEAESINRLMQDYGLSEVEAAEQLGITNTALISKLRLLKLSLDLRERIIAAGLATKQAKALLKIPEESRKEALDFILANQLNAFETDRYIDKLLSPPEAKPQPVRKAAIGDHRLFANSLTKMVDTMRQGGVSAETLKNETETHIEYTILIPKH